MHPTPTLAELIRRLEALNPRRAPILRIVQRHLHAVDRAARPGVRVAAHRVRGIGDLHLGAMRGGPNRRVDVPVVDSECRVFPNILRCGVLPRGDVLREDTIVVDMVVVVPLVLGHCNGADPFDHATANVAWHQQPHRVAVVGVEQLAIHHESKHARACGVHAHLPCMAGPISPISRGHLAFRGGKVDPCCTRLHRANTDMLQDLMQRNARPNHCRSRRATPMEANAFLDEVLLLAAIACAIERHGHGDLGQLHQFGHCQSHRLVHEPGNLDGVRVPEELGAQAVVADIVKGGGREEAMLAEHRQGSLTIEWMDACKPVQAWVARHPFVGIPCIALVRGIDLVGSISKFVHHGLYLAFDLCDVRDRCHDRVVVLDDEPAGVRLSQGRHLTDLFREAQLHDRLAVWYESDGLQAVLHRVLLAPEVARRRAHVLDENGLLRCEGLPDATLPGRKLRHGRHVRVGYAVVIAC
mmetsp:Transcript_109346/g.275076  ORF Transcript_109346/g.275076 Transcript_109346/m.275076 type:complete len:469 (-) Transcript_109346:190-1596(-)